MGTSAVTIAVWITLCGYHPAGEVPEESVDLMEINHFHDAEGRPVFDQILFYDWCPDGGRYQVRDWRLLKSPHQIPLPSARDHEFISVWSDFKARDAVRATKARVVRETWTQYDPELVEREFLPENKRRKLQELPASRRPVSRVAATSSPASAVSARPANAPRASLQPLQNPAR